MVSVCDARLDGVTPGVLVVVLVVGCELELPVVSVLVTISDELNSLELITGGTVLDELVTLEELGTFDELETPDEFDDEPASLFGGVGVPVGAS